MVFLLQYDVMRCPLIFDIHTFHSIFWVFRVPGIKKSYMRHVCHVQTGEIPFPTLPRGLHKSRLLFRSRHFAGFFRLKFGWRFKTPRFGCDLCGVFLVPKKSCRNLKMLCFCGSGGVKTFAFPSKEVQLRIFHKNPNPSKILMIFWDYLGRMGSIIKHNYA